MTEEATHTPGGADSLSVYDDEHGALVIREIVHDEDGRDHVGDIVAEIPRGIDNPDGYADLFAAAPETAAERERLREINRELIIALDRAVQDIDGGWNADEADEHFPWLFDARAALDRARGEATK